MACQLLIGLGLLLLGITIGILVGISVLIELMDFNQDDFK
jgi:hypothetical protein